MPLSRALKEVTTCSPANEKKVESRSMSEKAPKGKSKQFNQTGSKDTGPNYPQWHLGKGKPVAKI